MWDSVLSIKQILKLRNWVFATNSNFLISMSLKPHGVNLWYFKLRLFDPTEFIVWKSEFVTKTYFLFDQKIKIILKLTNKKIKNI